jgi:putative ABC transport system permease protein
MKTIRSLVRTASLSLTVIVTFAIATSVLALSFAFVWHILVHQLPFPEPSRLVFVWNRYGVEKVESSSLSAPDFADRRAARSFESAAVWKDDGANLTDGEPVRLTAAYVSGGFFSVLRMQPMLGSIPRAEEDAVVLRETFWRSRFGGRAGVIGTVMHLDGKPYRIAAVMSRDFRFPSSTVQLWIPLHLMAADFADTNRGNEYYSMVARLRAGVTVRQAQAEMDAITRNVVHLVPGRSAFLDRTRWHVDVFSMRDDLVRRSRPALLVMFGAGLLLMLLATTNVATLLIARTAVREREIAIRRALGAPPRQLLTDLIKEIVLLAVIGSAAGLTIARLSLPFVAIAEIPRIDEVAIGPDVAAFVVAAAVLASIAIAAGIASWTKPARLGTDRSGTGTHSAARLRTVLVAAQIAIAMTLAGCGALLVESYQELRGVDAGFDPHDVLTFRIELPQRRYPNREERHAFYRELLSRINALPGVHAAGLVSGVPFSGDDWTATFDIPGYDKELKGTPSAHFRVIDGAYPAAMRIPLRRGRTFTPADRDGAPIVCLIDDAAARRYWPQTDPIGKRLDFGSTKGIEIIGVIGTVLDTAPAAPEPHIYFALPQRSETAMCGVVRGMSAPLAGEVRAVVRAIDSSQPVYGDEPLEDAVADGIAEPRLRAGVVAAAAVLAVVIALLGLYGLISYVVAVRTREIGVRLALGATGGLITGLFLRWSASVTAAGVAIGAFATLAAMRLMRSLLFGVDAAHFQTVGALALLFLAVGVVAGTFPARRAARVDAAVALRND